MSAHIRATVAVTATVAFGVILTGTTSPATAKQQTTPGSVELTRLVKLNVDNRPLDVAILEIRRLVSEASSNQSNG